MRGTVWGTPGVDLLIMTAADKRRGGSSATTPKNPQSPKPNPKGGSKPGGTVRR